MTEKSISEKLIEAAQAWATASANDYWHATDHPEKQIFIELAQELENLISHYKLILDNDETQKRIQQFEEKHKALRYCYGLLMDRQDTLQKIYGRTIEKLRKAQKECDTFKSMIGGITAPDAATLLLDANAKNEEICSLLQAQIRETRQKVIERNRFKKAFELTCEYIKNSKLRDGEGDIFDPNFWLSQADI